MKTISILNLKGGVAKTFTAANMAYELYRRGYKVLLIDNDKQGNLSKAYSRYDAENVAPVTRLLAGDWENADELIQHTEYEGIDIVTANMSLFGATWNLTKEDSEKVVVDGVVYCLICVAKLALIITAPVWALPYTIWRKGRKQ